MQAKDGLREHSCVAQLAQHGATVECVGGFEHVGLDAANETCRNRLEQLDERGEVGGEACAHRRAFAGARGLNACDGRCGAGGGGFVALGNGFDQSVLQWG